MQASDFIVMFVSKPIERRERTKTPEISREFCNEFERHLPSLSLSGDGPHITVSPT
jgi:hypothetical protein